MAIKAVIWAACRRQAGECATAVTALDGGHESRIVGCCFVAARAMVILTMIAFATSWVL
jgi:hypothetical protein